MGKESVKPFREVKDLHQAWSIKKKKISKGNIVPLSWEQNPHFFLAWGCGSLALPLFFPMPFWLTLYQAFYLNLKNFKELRQLPPFSLSRESRG